jgi:hypothetical protein
MKYSNRNKVGSLVTKTYKYVTYRVCRKAVCDYNYSWRLLYTNASLKHRVLRVTYKNYL